MATAGKLKPSARNTSKVFPHPYPRLVYSGREDNGSSPAATQRKSEFTAKALALQGSLIRLFVTEEGLDDTE